MWHQHRRCMSLPIIALAAGEWTFRGLLCSCAASRRSMSPGHLASSTTTPLRSASLPMEVGSLPKTCLVAGEVSPWLQDLLCRRVIRGLPCLSPGPAPAGVGLMSITCNMLTLCCTTAATPSGIQCRLATVAGATTPAPLQNWAACTSPRAYSSLPDASYIFSVRATGDNLAQARLCSAGSLPCASQFRQIMQNHACGDTLL